MKAKKGDITHKLKIARGQIDGILQMIDENRYCVDISNQLQATQALLRSANQEILQEHIRNCVREALQTDVENPKLEEALELLVKMPDELRGIVKCANPKCITNNEPMATIFHVIDKDNCIVKCHYCEKEQKREEITIL